MASRWVWTHLRVTKREGTDSGNGLWPSLQKELFAEEIRILCSHQGAAKRLQWEGRASRHVRPVPGSSLAPIC